VDLVTTAGGLLERLHIGYYGATAHHEPPVQLALRLQATMDALRARLGRETFGVEGMGNTIEMNRQTSRSGPFLRQIHYHW
jgi:hypothetical protein